MVTTKPSSNGTAQKQTVTSSTATTAKVETPQAETKTETKGLVPLLPTVEQVRDKNRRLNDLFEKEAKLSETKANLQNFKVASDETTNALTLEDGRGSKFRTCNPTVIGSILELIKKDIDLKMSSTSAEIISLA